MHLTLKALTAMLASQHHHQGMCLGGRFLAPTPTENLLKET